MEKAKLVNSWRKFSSRLQFNSLKMHVQVQRLLTKNTMVDTLVQSQLRPEEMSVDGRFATSGYNDTSPFETESCWP
ncbi:hypothetical protein NC652_007050 [Populus alba x Populus x berolinensis]|nr:hypothetical protein NC652_007050 [Populus alba x Populus x berolinensis]